MNQSVLVAFDFDHTIIDDNTDVVARKLLPEGNLPDRVKGLYHSSGWIPYMGEIFKLLHENGIDAKQIETAIINIPAVPGLEKLLVELHARNYEIIIISDSNSVFINQWLGNKQLSHIITEIFTNPAKIDDSGILRVGMYHTQDWCKLSTVNLCKGHILQTYIKKRNDEGMRFDKVAYIGDGANDLCPITKLSENDLAFPRLDYALMNTLNNSKIPQTPSVKARVIPWRDGSDILRELLENV